MAKTIIKSTGLDITSIKNNLKESLQQTNEFKDYNFEGSGLAALLDVLAYNTHYNALIANYALNESFLPTAQLRSSVVGLAGSIGYVAGSRKSSSSIVELKVTDNAAPTQIVMPSGFSFSASVENKSYTFQTTETLTANAADAVSNVYTFKNSQGSTNIKLSEGVTKTKVFIAKESSADDIYIIPDETMDIDSVIIKVYPSSVSTTFETYTNIYNSTSINSQSTIYVLREAPNGFFELSFGNGSNLGKAPAAGSKIEVEYLSTVGPKANQARVFVPSALLGGLTVNVTTKSNSAGGLNKEGIESIRKNAPFLYAAQNRMVTAEDYAAIAQRNFNGFIEQVKAWGGEDNVPPKYGAVYLSIDFFDNLDATTKSNVKADFIKLAKDISVASFDVEYTDPIITYIELSTDFQWNPKLTSVSQSEIENQSRNVINNYLSANLGTFDQSFRRSVLLTQLDNSDASILSSKTNVKLQQRFIPDTSLTKDYSLVFPTVIATPTTSMDVLSSTTFTYNGKQGYLKNRNNSTVIDIISVETGKALVSNIGSISTDTGEVKLVGFSPSAFVGNNVKVSVVPSDESAITPVRNNILEYDSQTSITRAILTDSL